MKTPIATLCALQEFLQPYNEDYATHLMTWASVRFDGSLQILSYMFKTDRGDDLETVVDWMVYIQDFCLLSGLECKFNLQNESGTWSTVVAHIRSEK